jgi:segregation and condensation protein B
VPSCTPRPHGLSLLEDGERLRLVTAPECSQLIEPYLNRTPPGPLSRAALEVLAIVADEQPVSRADISHIRGTDSGGVADTLLARGLIADDARFGGRGRPSFLVTTEQFLRHLGIGSLAELPPRPAAVSACWPGPRDAPRAGGAQSAALATAPGADLQHR